MLSRERRQSGDLRTTIAQNLADDTNQYYLGLRMVNKADGTSELVKASWSATISGDTFKNPQARLNANRNKYKSTELKRYPYPVTEPLVCAECGKHLGGKSAHGKTKKHHYCC